MMINSLQSRNLAARWRAGSIVHLLLLAGLLAVVAPLRADNPPTYLYQIDSSAVPGGFEPSFLALDTSNNIYASFAWEGIGKFSAAGTYLTQWGSQGTGPVKFGNPAGIAVDSSNNVYVADEYDDRIEKLDSNGNYLTQWGSYGGGNGQFAGPAGVAVDRSNNVYVVETGNDRIEKFDSNGNYLTQWGSYGGGNGQFNGPLGIAVDSSNNVYVADEGNNRVEKFSSSGTYLTQWGSSGTNHGQFSVPYGMAVDRSNNVYVADFLNGRVQKFDGIGNYLTQWGSYGSGNGQFSNPAGVAVDSSGNFVYVADYANSRIQVFVNNTNIIPPYITLHPTNQIVAAGANVTLSVGVIGAEPFSYQWNFNNVAVPGATNASFTLTQVSLSASGNYSVLVTNSYGNALSSAELTVLPALVTTQPASGLSATGAMLNGSVTVGPEETVVWFEWGTDTNYGNIAGVTTVPGNNGSNSISATLSGLPGNVYHYRLDAGNGFGIVYGDDQLFTVGFSPAATTLAAINSTNGSTLEAAVNPEGWDTTVYFQWGTPTLTNTAPGILTNTTPGIDIGAGATSLNVSSFVPGLAPSARYQYRAVASNALGTAFGEVFYLGQSAPANIYLFSGSETMITLNPGTYVITAYGAAGGGNDYYGTGGGLGAEMSAEFNFSASTTLTLLVGGRGGDYDYLDGRNSGGGGGGGSFVVQGSTPLVIAGGGGGEGDRFDGGENGTVSINGGHGGPLDRLRRSDVYGGDGGSNGGGGAGGIGFYLCDYCSPPGPPGGGGGGFLGNGGGGGGGGGYSGGGSFEAGGYGGSYGAGYGCGGGYGGGGAGGGVFNGGGGGGGGGYSGGGGGGYSTTQSDAVGGGGGGGSIIDSSAITILAEVSGIASPDGARNGEIIVTAVSTPLVITTHAAFGFTNGAFGFDVAGPSGSNVVIQASTDLQTWIPLQTNLLGSGPLHFSDAQSTTNVHRFYRVQISP